MTVGTNPGFEAGNELSADPMAALQAELNSSSGATQEDQSEPETNPEPEGSEADENNQWGENPNPDGEPAEIQTKAVPKYAEIEIKGNKATRKFELNPENPDTKRTLEFGVMAPVWKQERDLARKEATAHKAELEPAKQKAAIWDELEELTKQGHDDQVVRAVLGNKYEQFIAQIIKETVEYDAASPEERFAMDKSKVERQAEWRVYQANRKANSAEAKMTAREDSIEHDRLNGLATVALQRNKFEGEDRASTSALNQKLWKLAWSELEDVALAGGELTPQVIASAFADNARVLKGAGARTAPKAVAVKNETKSVEATKQARAAATERMTPPKTQDDSSPWTGTSAKDVLKRLVRQSQGR